MAGFRITYYKNSFLASVVSVLSSIIGAVGGLMLAVAILDGSFEMVPPALVCLVLALCGGILGGKISAHKSNTKWWDEQIHKQNLEREIVNSVDFCFKAYNANPNEWTLNKIENLNADAAAQIRQALPAKKGGREKDNWMNKWIVGCLAVLVIIFGAALISGNSAPEQTQVYDLSHLAYTELKSGTIYEANDLLVVDCYAEGTYNDKTNVWYYLVLFKDYNGRIIAANMPVYASDDIHYSLLSYTLDESAMIGDCTVDCYVRTRQNNTSDSRNTEKMQQLFSEAVESYGELLGDTLIPLELAFSYHCSSSEDPLAK